MEKESFIYLMAKSTKVSLKTILLMGLDVFIDKMGLMSREDGSITNLLIDNNINYLID